MDLPACNLTLASLCSPGLQGPGCLPHASSVWEHSWKAWDTGYQPALEPCMEPDSSSSPGKCPSAPLCFMPWGIPCLLSLAVRLVCIPGPCGSRVAIAGAGTE